MPLVKRQQTFKNIPFADDDLQVEKRDERLVKIKEIEPIEIPKDLQKEEVPMRDYTFYTSLDLKVKFKKYCKAESVFFKDALSEAIVYFLANPIAFGRFGKKGKAITTKLPINQIAAIEDIGLDLDLSASEILSTIMKNYIERERK